MGHEPDIIDMVMNMSMIEMPVVKIRRLEIENFKNVKKGTITMPSVLKADVAGYGDILGIYGQNGSGKTAIVDALDTIKTLLCGMALPDDMCHLIMYGGDMCRISVESRDSDGRALKNSMRAIPQKYRARHRRRSRGTTSRAVTDRSIARGIGQKCHAGRQAAWQSI